MRSPRPGEALALVAFACALVATALLWGGAGGPSGKGDAVGVGAPGVDEGASGMGAAVPAGAEVTEYESGRSVVDEGAGVLERYEARGDCVLAHAGYIDLSGRAWACIVRGGGWVEICVVREGPSGGCSVTSWHMDAGDVAGGT